MFPRRILCDSISTFCRDYQQSPVLLNWLLLHFLHLIDLACKDKTRVHSQAKSALWHSQVVLNVVSAI